MKNVIYYYYQMNLENIHLVNGVYHFSYSNQNYLFFPIQRDISYLQDLTIFCQVNKDRLMYYHDIVLTKDNMPYLFLDNKYYVLLRVKGLISDTISFYDIKFLRVNTLKNSSSLVRFPWVSFWIKKCDYYENIFRHLEKKFYPFLPCFYWYLGLSENAISYVGSALAKYQKRSNDNLVVSHIRVDNRMNVLDFYNPLSIIVDHPSRDVAEYLKSLFVNGDYRYDEIEEYLLSLPLSELGFSLLFGRLLYPSFFFDLLDEFLATEEDVHKILSLGERCDEFRQFLKEIYFIIKRRTNIEEVRWIIR